MTFTESFLEPVFIDMLRCDFWSSKVNLVADEHDGCILLGCAAKLFEPTLAVVVGLLRRDIIHDYAAVGTSVEWGAERLIAFLSRSVPNLQHDTPPIQFDLFLDEVGTDCWSLIFLKFIVLKLL